MWSEGGLLTSDTLARLALSLMNRGQWHDGAALLLSGLSRGVSEGIVYGPPFSPLSFPCQEAYAPRCFSRMDYAQSIHPDGFLSQVRTVSAQ